MAGAEGAICRPAIMEYGQRPDQDADVGVAVHVASLAAWVEHVCNELLGPAWTGGSALAWKIPACWSAHPTSGAFEAAWRVRRTPDNLSFSAAVAAVLAAPVANRLDSMARDARLSRLIRNEGLHRGLSALSRREAHDAACILLRTAMGVWLVGR
jgi:hypothetical protein